MDSRFRGNDEWVSYSNLDPGLRRDDTNTVVPAQAGAQFHIAAITRERISA